MPGHGSRRYLGSLASTARRGPAGLYPARPRDPVWGYVLAPEVGLAPLAAASEPLVLVGQSHVAVSLALAGGRLDGGLAPGGTELDLQSGERWLINPGSVGQPRDGDARAAYLVLDLDDGRAIFRRVPYPVERTQAAIRERGLPEALAARLEHGL